MALLNSIMMGLKIEPGRGVEKPKAMGNLMHLKAEGCRPEVSCEMHQISLGPWSWDFQQRPKARS